MEGPTTPHHFNDLKGIRTLENRWKDCNVQLIMESRIMVAAGNLSLIFSMNFKLCHFPFFLQKDGLEDLAFNLHQLDMHLSNSSRICTM